MDMRIGKWALAVVLLGTAMGAQADDDRWFVMTNFYGL